MRSILAALLLALAVGAASAQPGRGPPSLPPTAMGPEKMRTAPPNAPDAKGQEVQRRARELRRAARRDAADGYRAADVLAAYERDTVGQWFRRGEIVLVGANPAVMATAAGMGLTERRRTSLTTTGIDLVTFVVPQDMDTLAALRTLKARHPEAALGLNYVYTE